MWLFHSTNTTDVIDLKICIVQFISIKLFFTLIEKQRYQKGKLTPQYNGILDYVYVVEINEKKSEFSILRNMLKQKSPLSN